MGAGQIHMTTIREYHERTKHSVASLQATRHFLDWDNQPLPFKIYTGLAPLPLPRDFAPSGVPALEAIAAKVMVPGASKKTQTRYVPITRKIEGKDHEITLGEYGTFRGHLVEGGLGGSPKIVNPPGADPIHHEYAQGRTSKMTYTDADQNWAWENSNYMFGTFTVDDVQYEKFAAGLAQKIAHMKDAKALENK